MKPHHTWLEKAQKLALLLLAAIGLSACAGQFGIGGDSWQEEVLLHDGQKIIVERYTLRGGRREVGQMGSYIAQSLSFTLPGTGQTIEWKDNRSEDLGNSSFLPMLLDIAKGTPYLVAYPMGCLSYNKWGRPNPPYVVFKYVANAWQRIPLEDLPLEIKTPNLVMSSPDLVAAQQDQRFVTAQKITELQAETRQPEYKTILREPMDYTDCRVPMVTNGKGLWLAKGWFSTKPTLEACQAECKTQEFDDKTCPCNKIWLILGFEVMFPAATEFQGETPIERVHAASRCERTQRSSDKWAIFLGKFRDGDAAKSAAETRTPPLCSHEPHGIRHHLHHEHIPQHRGKLFCAHSPIQPTQNKSRTHRCTPACRP